MHSSGHFYQTWDLLGFMAMYYKRVKFIAILRGFPDSSVGKESACNVGDLGLIPGLGRSPGEGTPVFWPRESHGLYSPWGCKEFDMTEQLSLYLQMKIITEPTS